MAATDNDRLLFQTLSSSKSLAVVIAADLNDSGDITDHELSKIEESPDQAGLLMSVLRERPADSGTHRRFANLLHKYDRQQYALPIVSTCVTGMLFNNICQQYSYSLALGDRSI